jgi:hypothetical protein
MNTMRIIKSDDCGNSPKTKSIQEIEIAFAKGDSQFLLARVTPDIQWCIVGAKQIEGMDALREMLGAVHRSPVTQIAIRHAFTHGKAGCVNGVRQHKDGKTYDFSTVYEFSSAKGASVSQVIHYAIPRPG